MSTVDLIVQPNGSFDTTLPVFIEHPESIVEMQNYIKTLMSISTRVRANIIKTTKYLASCNTTFLITYYRVSPPPPA